MVSYRFFRLARKPQSGAGRRYYRLVSYPRDVAEFATPVEARAYAARHKFAAFLSGGQWVALDKQARQCVRWHMAGKEGYVNVY